MKLNQKPAILSNPEVKAAARSTAEILLITAAAKAAISKCLSATKLPRKTVQPASELTSLLLLRDLALPMKLNGQVLFALGEGLEKFLGGKREILKPTVEAPVADEEPEQPEEAAEEPVVEEAVEETVEEEPVAEEPVVEEATEEEPAAEEPVVEEATEEEPAAEEPAVEAMAPVATEAETDESEETDFSVGGNLEYIDVKDEPEAYAALLARAEAGEVRLVTRYRQSYESRLIQSKDPIQDYYSGIKNALFAYKGVKSRISWTNETFRQGRNHIAKIIVKTSSLYLYLALDPEQLAGTKYESAVTVLSGRKKFETVPVLIKIKGERKYKYALEMINMVCEGKLQLLPNKKYEQTDYKRPVQTMEELVEAGLVRKLVAGEPVTAE